VLFVLSEAGQVQCRRSLIACADPFGTVRHRSASH
jgi:hypothetical protein